MSRRDSEDGIIEVVGPARIAEIRRSNYWPGRGLTQELVYTVEKLFDLLAEATEWGHKMNCWRTPCTCGYDKWLVRVKEILEGAECKHFRTGRSEYFEWCWDCGAVKRIWRIGDKFGEDDYQWHSCDLRRLPKGGNRR